MFSGSFSGVGGAVGVSVLSKFLDEKSFPQLPPDRCDMTDISSSASEIGVPALSRLVNLATRRSGKYQSG